ncbi:hypothetical protein B0H13DRAFT_1930772 [Mycena leptocephala]|nr:hypothetical protein B0H13DRAFT_1930772 [Mycena leptocephala]
MCLFPSYVLPVRLVSDLRRPGKPKVAFFLSEFSYPLIKISSWNTYVNALRFNCSATPPELPSPSPTSITIPLWALAMATATPKPFTFNLDVAAAFAAPTSTTSTRPSTTAISSPSPTSSSQTAGNIDTQFTSTDPTIATPVTATPTSTRMPCLSSGVRRIHNLKPPPRRRRHRLDLIATPLAIPPPAASFANTSTTDDSDSQRNGTTRQLYLQHEHHAAREKISNIQRQGNSTYATHGGVFSSSSTAPESNVGHRTTDPDMVAQMMELTARMREIEAQMQSPWALGPSDEGPPEYSDAGS